MTTPLEVFLFILDSVTAILCYRWYLKRKLMIEFHKLADEGNVEESWRKFWASKEL